MIRRLIPGFAFLVCLSCFCGCSGGGGEATFEASEETGVTAEEQKEADDYNKMLEEQSKKDAAEY